METMRHGLGRGQRHPVALAGSCTISTLTNTPTTRQRDRVKAVLLRWVGGASVESSVGFGDLFLLKNSETEKSLFSVSYDWAASLKEFVLTRRPLAG